MEMRTCRPGQALRGRAAAKVGGSDLRHWLK